MTKDNGYRCFCPDDDDWHRNNFNIDAAEAVRYVKKMRKPADLGKGFKTKINEQLESLRKYLRNLSPEIREIIRYRELDLIVKPRTDAGEKLLPVIHSLDTIQILDEKSGTLALLENLIEGDYSGKKKDNRLRVITLYAGMIWEKYGGKITLTENTTGFVAFLERLLIDTGLRFDDEPISDARKRKANKQPTAKKLAEKYLKAFLK